ncbi:MAG: hypothetical protein M5U07_16495 [Xanthobacteraceae bacterium]|nr:hypothetical protein [Xanthobacteraceae bacterium]
MILPELGFVNADLALSKALTSAQVGTTCRGSFACVHGQMTPAIFD